MTSTSVAARNGHPAPAPPHANPVHSHDRCLALFDSFLDHLRGGGWTPRRLDTYVNDRRPRWTVKHQFASGIWEIHLDRDLGQGVERTTVTISRYRDELPTVATLFDRLFGEARAEQETR